MSDSDVRRFWEKVDQRGDHECWPWTANATPKGYGQFRLGGRKASPQYAHRVSYVLRHGEIPDGCEICHRCHTPSCVNLEHLYAGSHLENVRHSARDGRLHVQRPKRHKLTDEQCNRILELVAAGCLQKDVAATYGVTKGFVSLLVKGKRRQYRKAS